MGCGFRRGGSRFRSLSDRTKSGEGLQSGLCWSAQKANLSSQGGANPSIRQLFRELGSGLSGSAAGRVPVQGRGRELPGEVHVLTKGGAQLGEDDFCLGIIGADGFGTQLSNAIFQWGSYGHLRIMSPAAVCFYTRCPVWPKLRIWSAPIFLKPLWTFCGLRPQTINQGGGRKLPTF